MQVPIHDTGDGSAPGGRCAPRPAASAQHAVDGAVAPVVAFVGILGLGTPLEVVLADSAAADRATGSNGSNGAAMNARPSLARKPAGRSSPPEPG